MKVSEIKSIEEPTIAIDFDGVIHKYSKGWQNGKIYDEPVEGVKEALEKLSKKYRLIVFTTRESGTPPELGTIKNTSNVWWWLRKNELDKYIYDVTNKKPKEAKLFIDDRAIRFENWEDTLSKVEKYVTKSITLFGKAIRLGKNPAQMDLFITAGTEKEFAPGDKRRLELTSGGKLRWKNADEVVIGQSSVVSGKSDYQKEMEGKYENAKKNLGIDDDLELLHELEKRLKDVPEPNMNRVMTDSKEAEKLKVRNLHDEVIRFIKKKNNFQDAPNRDQLYYESKDTEWLKKRNSAIASRVLGGKATDRELKINEIILEELEKRDKKKPKKEIDDEKIAELYRNSPISLQVDKMSNKAQEIYNNAGNQAEKQVAHDLWTLGNSIQEEFVAKYVKGEKISTEDVMEVKRIANETIKGAEEEFEKIKGNGKAKITIKKKNSDRSSGQSEDKIDYAQKLINTVQTSKTFDDFLKNIRISEFPNEFFKNELGLGNDTAQNIKKLKDYYSKQKATHREERKKDKEETDRAIAEFHVDEIERIALQQNAEYEKKISDRPSVETVKNPVQSEPEAVKKEPWEMTQREYLLFQRNDFGDKWHVAYEFEVPKEHKALIEQALKQGKPVPAEVLKDYPELNKETSLISELPFTASLKKDLEGYGEKTKNILVEWTYQPFADWFKKQYPDQEFKIGKYQDGEPFIAVNGGGEVRYSAYQKDNTEKKIKLSKLKKRKESLEDRLSQEKLKNNKKVSNIGFGTNMRGYQKTKQLSFRREDELAQKIKEINEEIKDLLPKHTSESNKSIFKNLFKAFGKQLSMFGAQPYSKEGQTKEGRGGTLKLTRDSSGKGAHWRLASKQNPNDNSPKANQIPKEENKMGGKVITPANAFELLQDKIGNSVLLQDNEGNLLGEGALQLVNENSEGNYSLFVKEANGFDSVVPIPKNQAVIQKGDEINFKFADKKIVISTKEKSKIPNKPIEMEKAEENAKHARNLEKMRNYNEWQKKADGYAKLANGQKDWFFGDLEIAADAEGLHLGVKDRIIKKPDVLFKEIRRNAIRDDKPEIFSALIGALEVKSPTKAKAFLSQLKKKGYEIDIHQLNTLDSKENFFTRVKISKGENDPLPKELQFATGEYAKAFDEAAKKPNPLRETEMSLGLKIAAESVPEFNTIKKQLFNKAGEGLGQLWVTGGLPGSGKSSTLGGEFYKNKVLIDPDGIKYLLAEQRGITKEEVDKKPWELHEESSNIAKHLVREAIREKKDVIYDVTMKGTENLNDLLYMVNSDTFQANAEFIHLPIEKGIERDKMRGEHGGRSIGADLYKKLFGDYPTHKAFFQLKDNFDSFRVYDNSAPLGEGAKLFYIKNDGQEKVLHPEIHEEFKKYGLRQMEKSLYLKYQRRKLLKALETEPKTADSMNPQELPTSEKIKLLLGFKEQGIDREIDPEQDFFALGMLKMHGLIDENMNLTPEGEQKYQAEFGNKFTGMNGEGNSLDEVVNPTKNIVDENGGEKKPAITAFGKKFNKGKQ